MGGLRRHPPGSTEADAPSTASSTSSAGSDAQHAQQLKTDRTSFLPPTSAHPTLAARSARNESLPPAASATSATVASNPLRGRTRLSNADSSERPSPYVQSIVASKSKRSRRAQRIPSIAAHLLASQTHVVPHRPSVPALSTSSATGLSRSPALVGSAGPLTAVSLPPLQRSQTVASPKHSSRRTDAVKQPYEEGRESEVERMVASSRNGRRSESLLIGGRLAELGRRRVEEDSTNMSQQAGRGVSEPPKIRQTIDSQARQQQQHSVEQRTKWEEEERKDERAPPVLLEPLISPSAATASSTSSVTDSITRLISHHQRPSLASFASSPLSVLSDHSVSSPPSASSARLPSSLSPFATSSAATTPNKRQTRRQLRAAESSMREAAELVAEGDIDGWVEAEWPLERGKDEEAERRQREGQRLGRVEVGVYEDPNRLHRQAMEDAHTICLDFNPPDSPPDLPTSSFLAVYDGHGGTFASTYSKRHLHRLFAKHLRLQEARQQPVIGSGDVVQAAFEAAFSELSDVMGRSKRFLSCGTTVVCCYVQQLPNSTVVHCANIGDAQAYLFSAPSSSTRLSTLHTAHNPAECERIESAGGHILLHRVNGVLAVTRALGDNGMHKAGLTAQPAYKRVELAGGTQTDGASADGWWLLLCCDGVSDVLSEVELRSLVVNASSGNASAALVASEVVSESLLHQSTDNVTACVLHIQPP